MGFAYGIVPMTANILGVGLLVFFVLKAPYHVSIMAGTCIAGISPAVAIPLVFQMMEANLGVKNGQNNSIFMGVVIENVVALTIF